MMSKKNFKVNNSDVLNEDNEVVTKGYLRSSLEQMKRDYERYMGALMEDNQHKFEQLIESFNMRTEAFARYMDGNEEDKEKINSRLNRLESKVLLA